MASGFQNDCGGVFLRTHTNMTIADRLAAKAKQELEIIEPLSDKDRKDWKRLREEVSAHQEAVCSFTAGVADIRDRRLYREEYGSFDAYVAAELSVSRRHVDRLIHHEEVKRILGPIGPEIPETQSRELTNVPPKKIPAVIKKATAKAKSEGRERTAKDVKAAAAEVKPKTVPKKVNPGKPEKTDSPEDAAKKVKSIADQHRDKLVRAIDDYHQHKPNARERDRLVNVVQGVSLW